MAQDDYYYEIQLTNKQLVFYFMAGATGLILSFLAGVMVGRGVDANGGEVRASHPVKDERVVEEPIRPVAPSPGDLTYPRALETDKVDDTLEKPQPPAEKGKGDKPTKTADAGLAVKPVAVPPPSVAPRPASTPVAKPAATPAPAKPTPAPAAATPAPAAATPAPSPAVARPSAVPPRPAPAAAARPGAPGTFTIQVGAFKDKSGADSVAGRLKAKGFAAFVEPGSGGLFNVRVGSYTARADAEHVVTRLRDDEKFKPFIVKN